MDAYIAIIKHSSLHLAGSLEYAQNVGSDRADCLYKLSVYLHKLSNQLNQNYRSALRYIQPDEQIDLLLYYYKEVVNCLTTLSIPVSNELYTAHQKLSSSHQSFKQNLLNGKVNLVELNHIEEVAEHYTELAKIIGVYYSQHIDVTV